jgi:hypothetical protein
MKRFDWLREIQRLDPDTDFARIYRITVSHEFPWDMNQALSFALYRTYAVPSIGNLLYRTGEFTERVQKRYDDTGLILDAVLEHGFGSETERVASVNYYRELGRHMGIKGIPATYQEFATMLDGYERAHFDYDAGARAVADSTLELMTTFPGCPVPHDGPQPVSRPYPAGP